MALCICSDVFCSAYFCMTESFHDLKMFCYLWALILSYSYILSYLPMANRKKLSIGWSLHNPHFLH